MPSPLPQNLQSLLDNIQKVILGKPEAVLWTTACLLARGHLLIEDVPGIGKTLLAMALARSISASFRRIQFTNDLLPSDIVGLSIFNPNNRELEFKPGPIFSHIVLADEVNRAPSKTQSALLEAMSELQVSVDGKTHSLANPFMVIATQNPVEYHGTFPLPEAQLDRFLLRVQIGYPSALDEKGILRGKNPLEQLKELKPVLTMEQVLDLQAMVEEVRLKEDLLDYAVAIAQTTRAHKAIKLGLSPRGVISLCQAARAFALLSGRDYCIPDDIKRVAVPVISHRMLLDTNLYGLARIEEAKSIVEKILQSVPSP